jgi:REP element-mobilizing transposase RayT
MNPYPNPSAAAKWYHVVCTTYRRRELLKIPATARFCERSIRDSCRFPGWAVHAVSVSPTQVRLLVKTPPRLRRQEVIHRVKKAATPVFRNTGPATHWYRPIWGDKSWCFALRSAAAITSVQRHIIQQSQGRNLLPVSTDTLFWPQLLP